MANKHKKLKDNVSPVLSIGLPVYTNDLNEPGTIEILKMFYKGALENTIGIARCKNSVTGKIESILVGVSPDEGGFYPLARVLDPQDAAILQPPDGKGGYFAAGEAGNDVETAE